jgi:hypothetical protein
MSKSRFPFPQEEARAMGDKSPKNTSKTNKQKSQKKTSKSAGTPAKK